MVSSQLEYAQNFLNQHPNTKLVTISLGGNDLLMLQDECNREENPILCKVSRLPQVALTLADNLVKIFKSLRETSYKGDIVIVTQYANNYKDAIQQLALVTIKNQIWIISRLTGVKVADAFEAMKKDSSAFNGSLCKAGFVVPLAADKCDNHPAEKGREILATTVMDAIKIEPKNQL